MYVRSAILVHMLKVNSLVGAIVVASLEAPKFHKLPQGHACAPNKFGIKSETVHCISTSKHVGILVDLSTPDDDDRP